MIRGFAGRASRATALVLALAGSAFARKPEPIVCPPPTQGQVFVSPVGEPFRAPKGQPYPVALWFAGADADHDGRLTAREMEADAARFFKVLDRNHDGEIDPAEVEYYEYHIAPEIMIYAERGRQWDRPDRKADVRYGGAMGAGRFAFLNIPEPVSAADADMNRGVSLDEFKAAARRRFETLDTARQGFLTLAGLPKTPVEVMAEQPCHPFDEGKQRKARPTR